MSKQREIILLVSFVMAVLVGLPVSGVAPCWTIPAAIGTFVIVFVCLSAIFVGARADRHAGKDE